MSNDRTESLFETKENEPSGYSHIARIVFETGADTGFDYLVPDELWPLQTGQRVEVPFGRKNKPQIGFCILPDVPPEKSFVSRGSSRSLKKVTKVVDKGPLLDSGLMKLAGWISQYYVCPLGQVLAAMLPSAVKKGIGVKTEKYIYLAGTAEETLEKLRGKKQKEVVAFLRGRGAYEAASAVEVQKLLSEACCTKAPVKALAQKQIIKISEKASLKALPVIPEEMLESAEPITLNDDQQKALDSIETRIQAGRFGVTLLHGVNDSGKTEIYIRVIKAIIRQGKSAIILLPEIALTAQTVQRFGSRFANFAVMHSGLTASQRNAQWQKIKASKANVVIGARSAVFAPLPNLGLIVIDEEHEPSYKQDTAPRYHGRDVAIKRAQLSEAHCILGSATPSLEMLLNCRNKEYFNLIELPRRVMDLPAPEMKLVDLKQQQQPQKGVQLISEPLAKHLEKILAKKEQAILLLNRRGYSNFVFCPSCKHTLHCRNCDATLTFHKSRTQSTAVMQKVTDRYMNYGYALCHYCLAQTLVPKKCPLCGSSLAMIGLGSQRLEEELKNRFPNARIARVDSDSMAGKDYYRLLADFGKQRINILAGTQMLAKGLHFPNVTLVGIISADTSLYLPDFRANERTFQLICQVAGRAGRSSKKGTVFIQTFLPDQPAIQFALKNDYSGFVNEELKHRRNCNLPPFWRLAVVLLRDMNYEKLEIAAQSMREKIDNVIQQFGIKAAVRGPMPAPISRLQRFHRMQIIIQSPQSGFLRELFIHIRAGKRLRPAVKVAIDVDPVNLL
ncbi:primosomal protein N' [Planctomycetota bacterium]